MTLRAWMTIITTALVTSTAYAAGSDELAHHPYQDLPPAVAQAALTINAQRIGAQVQFLSSDLLEGRDTGSRGGRLAAAYIASQFALAGLKPAGDNGTYFQSVKLVGITTDPSTTFSLQPAGGNPIALKYGEDFVTTDESGAASSTIDAPIVFVGYGIDAPQYHWNDFKGANVRGKVLLMFSNEPTSHDARFFDGKALTYYGRWTYKFEQAAKMGAVGVLLIHRDDLASYPWSVVKNSWDGEEDFAADKIGSSLKAASWIQWDVAKLLFASSGKKIDDMLKSANSSKFKPVQLPVRLKAQIVSTVRDFSTDNVLAMMPGRDHDSPHRAIMYTAHYDHLGLAPNTGKKGEDLVYNGAVDNATGSAMLIEVARAYARCAIRPPHPVFFAAVTGEEKGLLGSAYLSRHLPLPTKDFALDLNFDAVPPLGTPQSIVVTGAKLTSFYPTVETTAKHFGLNIQADHNPGAGHYFRSDHFSFVRVGIPAFSITAGDKFVGHPLAWGISRKLDYSRNRYHQASDEYSSDMNFATNQVVARFSFALGWHASGGDQPITWTKTPAVRGSIHDSVDQPVPVSSQSTATQPASNASAP